MIYSYFCTACSRFFEISKPVKDSDMKEACPFCHSMSTKKTLHSVPTIFKDPDFTQYKSEEEKKGNA